MGSVQLHFLLKVLKSSMGAASSYSFKEILLKYTATYFYFNGDVFCILMTQRAGEDSTGQLKATGKRFASHPKGF